MTTFFNNCDITIRDLLGSQLASASTPGFINVNYDPTYYADWNRGGFTIEFHYDDTFEDFSKFYVNRSMVIETYTNFEPGYAEFEIWEAHPDFYNLPIYPQYNQVVKIKNRDGSRTIFVGRLAEITPVNFDQRTDGTENRRLKIKVDDLKIDFKRFLVTEAYPDDTTTYSIIKDLIDNHTPFDGSDIDTTKGFKLDGYILQEDYPSKAIGELLDLEVTATLWVDPDTLKVYVSDNTEAVSNIMTLNEANQYDYVRRNDIYANPLDVTRRNLVKMWFTGSYAQGTCNVANGSSTVIGVGTKWSTQVKAGAEFRVVGDAGVYTVQEINSDTDITLSSAYDGTTESGADYTLSAYRDYIIVDDGQNTATMAEVLGESGSRAGVFEVKAPERRNPMTREQARAVAEAYLARMSGNVFVKGGMITDSERFNFDYREGQSISVDLPLSKNLVFTGTINRLRLEHTGAMTRRDPEEPHMRIIFDFTDRRLLAHNAIEKLFQDIRDVQITDDEVVELVKTAYEIIGLADCVGIDKAFGPHDDEGGAGAEEITITEEFLEFNIVTDNGPYYISPVSGGQSPLIMLDANNISFLG